MEDIFTNQVVYGQELHTYVEHLMREAIDADIEWLAVLDIVQYEWGVPRCNTFLILFGLDRVYYNA